jgi:heterotetrameric sarcosine oxidase gamma subunit
MAEYSRQESVVEDPEFESALVTGRRLTRVKAWSAEEPEGGPTLLHQHLPHQVGMTLSGPLHVLCLGPGDWLIGSTAALQVKLTEELSRGLSERGYASTDVTDAFACLELRGRAVRDLLSRSCGLDLHIRHFPPGRCATTRFAQVPAIMEHLQDPSRFEMTVARSHMSYIRRWIEDSFQG